MELLPALRMLWRRRLLVAAGFLAAIAMAVVVGCAPPSSSAVARTRVTLDTRKSQLVESAPPGVDTLPWRASMITHLMQDDSAQRGVAQRLGVDPSQIEIVDPVLAVPVTPASMPLDASDAASVTAAPYVVTVGVVDTGLPMISIEAAAPDRRGAARLAEATVAVLETYASPKGRYRSLIKTGGGAPATFQPFVVRPIGDVRVKTVKAAALPIKAVVVPGFLLAVWIGCLAFVPRRPRRQRPRVVHA
jgi:hypothetical protein